MAANISRVETAARRSANRRPAASRLAAVVALAALATGACRPSPGPPLLGYSHALLGPDCQPAGGSAVALVLRPFPDSFDAVGPQLRVAVWRDLSSALGRTFSSRQHPNTGGGYECGDTVSCAPLRSWRIEFGGLDRDSIISGRIEVQGSQGPVRSGTFRAAWRFRRVYCI
jgi:hypothetical protein